MFRVSLEPDHDWTARFFNDVQDVSSEDTQLLYAKILAGEVERSGRTSTKTLGILRDLDRATAGLFRTLCSASVSILVDEFQYLDARVPSLGGNPGTNCLQKFGLGFDALNVLSEYGLIISDYNSWYDYKLSIGITIGDPVSKNLRVPLKFQGRYWVLLPTTGRDLQADFQLTGVKLTRSGRELAKVVDIEALDKFASELKEFFLKNNLQMAEVPSGLPIYSARDTLNKSGV